MGAKFANCFYVRTLHFQCLSVSVREISRYTVHHHHRPHFRLLEVDRRNSHMKHQSRLQQIQNSLARTVMKAPTSCHITPILRSLHWLRITERIEYKLLSLTYKVLTTTQPPYLHNLIYIQRPRSTRLLLLGNLHYPL